MDSVRRAFGDSSAQKTRKLCRSLGGPRGNRTHAALCRGVRPAVHIPDAVKQTGEQAKQTATRPALASAGAGQSYSPELWARV